MTRPFDDRRFAIDDDGWIADTVHRVERIPSPNFDERPDARLPTLVVIHAISLPPGSFRGRAVDALFTNTLDHDAHPYFRALVGLRVSAHLLIRRNGDVAQFVPFVARAWHAGVSTFEGRESCNDFSIGIELEGDDFTAFDDEQYVALVALIDALCDRYPIDAIAGHSDIAPSRKTDPGPFFDWSRLRGSSGEKVRSMSMPAC